MKNLRLAAAVAALCLTPAFLSAAPETFKIDPVHSFAIFKIGHYNVGHVYGEFTTLTGTFVQDKEAPENSKFEVTIDANSLDTKNTSRDAHVKGPDFLSVKQFPTITFKSDSVKPLADNQFEVAGQFTLHGVTKPITAKFTKIGEAKDPKGAFRAGGESTFTIKRSDYGVTGMLNNVGDEVTITIALEGVRQE